MNKIEIKHVAESDVSDLQKISRQTFYETFSEYNSKSDIDKYLNENLSVEKLTNEIKTKGSEFYFAIYDGSIIGYLKVNEGGAQTELQDYKSLEIERIYVVRDFHGKNIGHYLYKKAKEIAIRKSVDYIWLGVWEKNERAIRFYKKNGFVAFDKHIFRLGDDEQIDIMMKLQLKKED